MARGVGKDPAEVIVQKRTLPGGTKVETRSPGGLDRLRPKKGRMSPTTGGGLKAKPSKKRGGRKPKMGY